MNRLRGEIIGIESAEEISLVCADIGGGDLITVALVETPATCDYLRLGKELVLVFKETEVLVAKNLSGGISTLNRKRGVVTAVQHGMLLSRIDIDFSGRSICSVIATDASRAMGLACGDEIEWLVKANEIMLMEEDEE